MTGVLVVSDPFMVSSGLIGNVSDVLEKEGIPYSVYSDFSASPTVSSVEAGATIVSEKGYDGVIGFGGGSSLDVAKAVSILKNNPGPASLYFGIDKVPVKGAPLILIPTTAGTGSEVSDACILKDDTTHIKGGIRSKYIISDIALLDPGMTASMPPRLTASTGMDALAHAVEGYVSNGASVLTRMYHLEAIRLIHANLRNAVANGNDPDARYNMMLGSLYAGWAMAVASLGACHAMSYSVEGKYSVPHGESCAAMLPSVMQFNALGNMERFKEMAIAMGQPVDGLSLRDAANKAVEAVRLLAKDIGIRSLGQIGVKEEDLGDFAKTAVENKRLMSFNPRGMSEADCAAVFRASL